MRGGGLRGGGGWRKGEEKREKGRMGDRGSRWILGY